MRVVINLSSVEFRIFEHVLNEILQIPAVRSLHSLEIQKNALALCERATVVWLRGRLVSSLCIQNHIRYCIQCSMLFSAIWYMRAYLHGVLHGHSFHNTLLWQWG